MTGAIDRAASGVRLGQAKVASAAHNTANLLTPDATRTEARGVEGPAGGVQVEISAAASSSPDPVGDVLSSKQGAMLYQANLSVIASEDRRLGETIDLLG